MSKGKQGKISIVVGGMFGSEGKGRHVEVMTRHRLHGKIHVAVRTGAPNAGHTVYDDNGLKYAMQQIPCSFIDPDVELVLGAGAQIHPEILHREAAMIAVLLGNRKIIVDKNAIIQFTSYQKQEQDLGMHARMGSTAEGCGEALKSRISRDGSVVTFEQVWVYLTSTKPDPERKTYEFMSTDGHYKFAFNEEQLAEIEQYLRPLVCEQEVLGMADVAELLWQYYNAGAHILLEGTQGAGLSLFHGPDYPHCTSRDTNAANWLMEAGLPPNLNIEVHMVMRAFPIRVAGKSGYMPDELEWDEFLEKTTDLDREMLARLRTARINAEEMCQRGEIIKNDILLKAMEQLSETDKEMLAPFIEKTTVTKKVRRIGKFNEFYGKYLHLNNPDVLVIQFADYLNREAAKQLREKHGKGVIPMTLQQAVDLFGPNLSEIVSTVYYTWDHKIQYLGIDAETTICLYDQFNQLTE